MRLLKSFMPSFKMAMFFTAFGVWMATYDYAELLEAKKAGCTGYVIFLCLLLSAFAALSPRFAFIRSFVFRGHAPSDAIHMGSRLIVVYSAILAVLHFSMR